VRIGNCTNGLPTEVSVFSFQQNGAVGLDALHWARSEPRSSALRMRYLRGYPAVSIWIPSEPLKPGPLATDELPLRPYLVANAKDDWDPWYQEPTPEPLAGALH
jgi:hypothetical protein